MTLMQTAQGSATGGVGQRALYALAKLVRDVIVAGGIGTAIQWVVTEIGGDSPTVMQLGLVALAVWRIVRPQVLAALSRVGPQ